MDVEMFAGMFANGFSKSPSKLPTCKHLVEEM